MYQIQLNRKLQPAPFNFVQRYIEYTVLSFLVSFYVYLVPLATPMLAVIFFIQYWVDKFNLFRRFNAPVIYSYSLSILIFKIFQSVVVLFALGTFLFIPYAHNSGYTILNFVTLGVAIAYTVLVWVMPHSW